MIEIKTGDIPCCVYVSEVEEHQEIKAKFFKFLAQNNVHGTIGVKGDEIYNTDYFVKNHSSIDNSYFDIVSPIFDKHNDALSKFLNYVVPISTGQFWFQQYKKNNKHSWHRHKNSIFSNVYYVDLPEGTSKTKFRFLGREFTVDVKEGQILTFPSFIEHCSKPSLSEHIKTVISFNSS